MKTIDKETDKKTISSRKVILKLVEKITLIYNERIRCLRDTNLVIFEILRFKLNAIYVEE